MKILFVILFLVSCKPLAELEQNNGKAVLTKLKINSKTTQVSGVIYELSSNEYLSLADVWINNKRFPCDSLGRYNIKISNGKYKLEARSFGFVNYKYNLFIKKGEELELNFYLEPFIMENRFE